MNSSCEFYVDVFKTPLTLNFLALKTPCAFTASGSILASGNLCFRVFKLQLKVININVYYCTAHE